MIKYFSQRDPRWSRLTISRTALTLNFWGCTITSICNALLKFGHKLTPEEALSHFGFNAKGEVYWKTTNLKIKSGMFSFVWRGYTNIEPKKAAEYTNDPKKACLVRLKQNPRHWVLLHKWTSSFIPWFLCVDPNTWNEKTKSAKIVRKLKRSIDGYSLFQIL